MPGRLIPFATNEMYHVFNRGIDHRPTFTDRNELRRSLEAISYYRFTSPPIRLSKFLIQSTEIREKLFEELQLKNETLIDILSFCLMPNHYHLLLRQKVDNGITKFMRKINTGYTMYFNLKNERTGRLFESRFKSVHVDSDRYLKHLWNYIHLNPLDLINKDWRSGEFEDTELTLRFIKDYPWSSYKFFDNSTIKSNILNKDILDYGINVGDSILEWPSRNLESISHLTLEG